MNWSLLLGIVPLALPYLARRLRPSASVDLTALAMGAAWIALLVMVICGWDVVTPRSLQWGTVGFTGVFTVFLGGAMLMISAGDDDDGSVRRWFDGLDAEIKRRFTR